MELIHVLVRPYASTIHNVIDGIILQLIVIISVLPLVEIVDDYNETLILVIAYSLVILPMTSFVAIKLLINRSKIQKELKHLFKTCSHINCNKIPANNETQEPTVMQTFDIVVDDDMRRNAIVVDV